MSNQQRRRCVLPTPPPSDSVPAPLPSNRVDGGDVEEQEVQGATVADVSGKSIKMKLFWPSLDLCRPTLPSNAQLM